MRDASKSVLDKAVKLRLQGYGLAEVMASTGLNHSQVEDACYLFVWHYVLGEDAVTMTPEVVAWLRDGLKLSWGHIGAMGGQTDPKRPVIGAARYNSLRRMYEEYTDMASVAQRNGRGGRYYAGEPALYEDNLKATGTLVKRDQLHNVRQVAEVRKLMALGAKELRSMCDDAKVSYTKSTTAAVLAKRLVESNA